jgi:hypothetical protein
MNMDVSGNEEQKQDVPGALPVSEETMSTVYPRREETASNFADQGPLHLPRVSGSGYFNLAGQPCSKEEFDSEPITYLAATQNEAPVKADRFPILDSIDVHESILSLAAHFNHGISP